LFETVPANSRIPQAFQQEIPDRRASHTESLSAIKAQSLVRYNQELSGGGSEMLPRRDACESSMRGCTMLHICQ